MSKFYLTKKTSLTGSHSIHKEGCPFLQNADKNIVLGEFESSNDAVWKARMIFHNSKACIFCSKESMAMAAPAYYEWNMFSTS